MENLKENLKENFKENFKEKVKENFKENFKENVKENFKVKVKENFKENLLRQDEEWSEGKEVTDQDGEHSQSCGAYKRTWITWCLNLFRKESAIFLKEWTMKLSNNTQIESY